MLRCDVWMCVCVCGVYRVMVCVCLLCLLYFLDIVSYFLFTQYTKLLIRTNHCNLNILFGDRTLETLLNNKPHTHTNKEQEEKVKVSDMTRHDTATQRKASTQCVVCVCRVTLSVRIAVLIASSNSISLLYLFSRNVFAFVAFLPIALAFHAQ